MEEGGWWRCGGGHGELSELYRELQLLRLKYDQLVDVCRKLSKPWRVDIHTEQPITVLVRVCDPIVFIQA